MDDINDPITHPFNFAQDRESWYAEVAAAAQEEYRLEKAKRQTLKKRKVKSKSLKTKSFIMRKESDRAQRVIKIIIYDLDGGNMDEISSNPEDASVNVQYLVTSEYDDIMTETEYLVDFFTPLAFLTISLSVLIQYSLALKPINSDMTSPPISSLKKPGICLLQCGIP
ncbi:hypothetical protein B5X24_HaOG205503 [Helicoverpa armigera]|nr:hypothetical protein B5X24_HaOG205503 [Helicoverpa armigera]